MRIDVVEGFDDLEGLHADWDAVYAADPEASLFMSWRWMSDWLRVHRTPFLVLAARPDDRDEYVALLPLRISAEFDTRFGFTNRLYFAGDGFSDYTGILARPEFEAEAIPAFAEHLKRRLHWAELTMPNLRMSERRRRLFFAAFESTRFAYEDVPQFDKSANVDNSRYPVVDLPGDWDTYLATLSANNRQKIRRLLRKVDTPEAEDIRITVSDASTYARDVQTLMRLWRVKWEPLKEAHKIKGILHRNRAMLTRCAAAGTLYLPVFWRGEQPIAALGILVDEVKKAFLFLIAGRDESYDELPAGYLLHAWSIRHAITRGMASYDFLKGDEPYKLLFAPTVHEHRAAQIVTRNRRNLGDRLDPRSVESMLQRAADMEQDGNAADARIAYRQLLEACPDDPLARYRFGCFLMLQGDHAEAEQNFLRAASIDPSGDSLWLMLARARQSLGDLEGARTACREALRLHPGRAEIRRLLLNLEADGSDAMKKLFPFRAAANPFASDLVDPAWVKRKLEAGSPAAPALRTPTRRS